MKEFLVNWVICLIIALNFAHDNPVVTVITCVGGCLIIRAVFRAVHLALSQNRTA